MINVPLHDLTLVEPDDELWRLELPFATCGFYVRDGVVIMCPPIIGWARGRLVSRVVEYAKRKGGECAPNADFIGRDADGFGCFDQN